jgi:hypothetical protein
MTSAANAAPASTTCSRTHVQDANHARAIAACFQLDAGACKKIFDWH